MDTLVPMILGCAVLAAFIATAAGGFAIIKSKMQFLSKLLMFISLASLSTAMVTLSYFIASWLPYNLEHCTDELACAADETLRGVLSVRWEACLATLLMITIAVLCVHINASRQDKLPISD